MNNTINLSIMNITGFNAPQRINIVGYYKDICTQLSDYFVRTGLIIVCLYLFFSWFNWWFFNHGYKKISYDSSKGFCRFIGNLEYVETRIYWDIWIKDKLSKLMMGYIVIVIYFNWG